MRRLPAQAPMGLPVRPQLGEQQVVGIGSAGRVTGRGSAGGHGAGSEVHQESHGLMTHGLDIPRSLSERALEFRLSP